MVPLLACRQIVQRAANSLIDSGLIETALRAVALFTAEGAVLLDGTTPTALSFDAAGQVTAGMTVGTGLALLTQNGAELTASQMRLYAGGSLAANFAIRDELAPAIQASLDDLAYDLHERLADPAVDSTLNATSAGLFTDSGARASLADKTGLAGRISVNAVVVGSEGGAVWRLRSGLQAGAEGAVGDASLLIAVSDALEQATSALTGTGFSGKASLADRLGTVESQISTVRVRARACNRPPRPARPARKVWRGAGR